jgi:ribosomal-protein-alanine N-acetyltransferase
MLVLRKPCLDDLEQIQQAYQRSRSVHHPWVTVPENFESYLNQDGRYFLCSSEVGNIIGTFNISGVIRGYFQSAYLGYEVFNPYQGKGFMKEGLNLLLQEAFGKLNLHRLEANIQPGNAPSIRLVASAGFVKEGFSRQYLKVGGEWRDHERWAIINKNWVGHS